MPKTRQSNMTMNVKSIKNREEKKSGIKEPKPEDDDGLETQKYNEDDDGLETQKYNEDDDGLETQKYNEDDVSQKDNKKIKKTKTTLSIVDKSLKCLKILLTGEFDEKVLNKIYKIINKEFKPALEKIISTENSLPKKAKKDPNAPKKGRSSYILFCNDNRASVKEEFSNHTPVQIISELGSKWRESSDKTKNSYTTKAKKDKERYIKEFEDYTPSEGFEKPEVKSPKKDPKSPKRGTTAYIYFCKDKRPKLKEANPEMKGKEITSELSSMWKNISDRKKVKYTDLATEDKKRYTDELDGYTPSEGFEKPISKESATITKPRSSFVFFSKEQRYIIKQEKPEMDYKEVVSELSIRWKNLKDSAKEKYIELARKDKERYNESLPVNTEIKHLKNAFMFFSIENKQRIKETMDDGITSKELTIEIGRIWREEYKEDKKKSKPYIKAAEKDKKRFIKESAEFIRNSEDEDSEQSENEQSENEQSENEQSENEHVTSFG
jgi:hypothetical protein